MTKILVLADIGGVAVVPQDSREGLELSNVDESLSLQRARTALLSLKYGIVGYHTGDESSCVLLVATHTRVGTKVIGLMRERYGVTAEFMTDGFSKITIPIKLSVQQFRDIATEVSA